ncbi:MAG: DJ-1/PfpI family protein [Clostridia bacterium]|nr:DJ-1/PfpI family protein [Clostridia bacterium]
MKKVAIMLADGFEEIEALSPFDVLKRAEIKCDFISIKSDLYVKGAHGVVVKSDRLLEEASELKEYDMIILPGGMPGAKYLSENEKVLSIIKSFDMGGKLIAAICASPALVLTKANIVNNKRVTCYPGMEENFNNSIYVKENVVVDGNIITSRGPATALEFSYKLVEILGYDPESIKGGMLYKQKID